MSKSIRLLLCSIVSQFFLENISRGNIYWLHYANSSIFATKRFTISPNVVVVNGNIPLTKRNYSSIFLSQNPSTNQLARRLHRISCKFVEPLWIIWKASSFTVDLFIFVQISINGLFFLMCLFCVFGIWC